MFNNASDVTDTPVTTGDETGTVIVIGDREVHLGNPFWEPTGDDRHPEWDDPLMETWPDVGVLLPT